MKGVGLLEVFGVTFFRLAARERVVASGTGEWAMRPSKCFGVTVCFPAFPLGNGLESRGISADSGVGYEGWAVLRFGPRLRGSLNPVLVLMD